MHRIMAQASVRTSLSQAGYQASLGHTEVYYNLFQSQQQIQVFPRESTIINNTNYVKDGVVLTRYIHSSSNKGYQASLGTIQKPVTPYLRVSNRYRVSYLNRELYCCFDISTFLFVLSCLEVVSKEVILIKDIWHLQGPQKSPLQFTFQSQQQI